VCRLFGFRSVVPGRAHRSLLDAENALARQSTQHPDGWGIGWFHEDDAYVVKSSSAAYACDRFKQASARLSSHTMLVHVRRATVGTVDHLNAHPFRFGRWLFAHNGTLFGFEALRPWLLERTHPELAPLVLGDTDSEHLFHYLLSRLDAAGLDRSGREPVDAVRAAEALRDALRELDAAAVALGLERPITNVLLTDGRIFLAHRAGMPLHVSTQKFRCADFATCREPSKVCMLAERPPGAPVNHLLVASEPIGEENRWEPVVDGSTLALDARFHLSVLPPAEGWVAPELPAHLRALAAPSCALD
jgi:glutamine amidotransferase